MWSNKEIQVRFFKTYTGFKKNLFIFIRKVTVKICHCFCVCNIPSKITTFTRSDIPFSTQKCCAVRKKKGKHPLWTRSCHADVPSPVEMATVPASNNCARDVQWVQCVWDVLSILLFGCRIDLCAQIKSQAVPALHELILLRFPRWKNGSLRWMGK